MRRLIAALTDAQAREVLIGGADPIFAAATRPAVVLGIAGESVLFFAPIALTHESTAPAPNPIRVARLTNVRALQCRVAASSPPLLSGSRGATARRIIRTFAANGVLVGAPFVTIGTTEFSHRTCGTTRGGRRLDHSQRLINAGLHQTHRNRCDHQKQSDPGCPAAPQSGNSRRVTGAYRHQTSVSRPGNQGSPARVGLDGPTRTQSYYQVPPRAARNVSAVYGRTGSLPTPEELDIRHEPQVVSETQHHASPTR